MTPFIYNLFPRLAGRMPDWLSHAERAQRMGFNHLYINPLSFPGFSGSLYAVKDYYRVCPDFLPAGHDGPGLDELQKTLAAVRSVGLRPVMDLVINHTAFDSELTHQHPEWYVRDAAGNLMAPRAIDPADARKVTVWGDLAEINNEATPDRDGLWGYWRELVRRSVELGWQGFRCDAAYKVPAGLWRALIAEARTVDPSVLFFAETLGCRLEEVRATMEAGFDFLFNSVKYWQFDAPWAIDQHNEFAQISPSVSFPESHDTARLFTETSGNLAVHKQRYILAAMFASGVLMPVGYEFGFRRRLNVVTSSPKDWENTGLDLSAFIAAVNQVKTSRQVLRDEGFWTVLTRYDRPTLALEKVVHGDRMLFLVNKDWWNPNYVDVAELPVKPNAKLLRFNAEGHLQEQALSGRLALQPAEIALVD
jgi:starch synthase (maltosyl-transferring)